MHAFRVKQTNKKVKQININIISLRNHKWMKEEAIHNQPQAISS